MPRRRSMSGSDFFRLQRNDRCQAEGDQQEGSGFRGRHDFDSGVYAIHGKLVEDVARPIDPGEHVEPANPERA